MVGEPIYAGGLTATVKAVLSSITIDQGAKGGIYGSGQGITLTDDIAQIQQSLPTCSDSALSKAVVVKIGESKGHDVRAQELVNQLTG